MSDSIELNTKYFVEDSGKFIGGFFGGVYPVGGIEVPDGPSCVSQIWQFPGWSPIPVSIENFVQATQEKLDNAAKVAGYDDIKTAVTYADEPAVPRFQAEGQAFRAWRSKCWAYCYEQLAQVQGGKRAQPTIPELLAELPLLELPHD
jgi:hypothetical protein